MLWVKKGDVNFGFYHKFASIRMSKNRILAILDDQRRVCSGQSEIENCFSGFYSNLWSSSSSDCNLEALENLPPDLNVLSPDDKDLLIALVSRKEIF